MSDRFNHLLLTDTLAQDLVLWENLTTEEAEVKAEELRADGSEPRHDVDQ